MSTTTTTTTTSPINVDTLSSDSDEDDNDVVIDESQCTFAMLQPETEQCAICLGALDTPAIPDACNHWYCLICLYQWANISQHCPLCKRWFGSIIYHIRSASEFERFKLEPTTPAATTTQPTHRPARVWGSTSSSATHWSNSFPFTPAHERRSRIYKRALRPLLESIHAQNLPNLLLQPRKASTPKSPSPSPTPTLPRLASISDISVPPITEELWSSKAVAWVTRELQALIEEQDVDLLVRYLHAIIVRKYNGRLLQHVQQIESDLGAYLFEHTRTFVHEFAFFMASRLNLASYERLVCYVHDSSQATTSTTPPVQAPAICID
jgi:hypothetical protein